jgi:hypothetical protein
VLIVEAAKVDVIRSVADIVIVTAKMAKIDIVLQLHSLPHHAKYIIYTKLGSSTL